jgi:Bacterial TSP3 repeat
MKFLLILIVSLFCANLPLSAQGNGIEQPSDVVTVGASKFLRWYGRPGRTYFIQVSDPNDHLARWQWAPIIESGNNGYISYEVDGTADKGLFRLKYTDKPTTDPDYDDFDGDTISNLEEIIDYGSDPLNADTDSDGMPDNYEVTHYLNPNYRDERFDYDRDGSTNLQEYNLATNPTYRDTDSDGMDDGFEVTYLLNPLIVGDATSDADGDGLSNLWEYKFKLNPRQTDSNSNGVSDALEDHDRDRLTNLSELVTHQTLPDQPDTDGDGLSDGWEILYGYSALVNNQTDASPNNNSEADPDNDGLINHTEDQLGTNPNNADTDGDGFSDFAENQAGSNATGAGSTPGNPGGTPGGPATTPPPTIPVKVKFGDHSGSHSEKYEVQLEPLEGDANTQKRSFKNSHTTRQIFPATGA